MAIRIHLDKPGMIFSPGESITGSIVTSLGSKCTYKCITCTFTGEGQVLWTDNDDFEFRPESLEITHPHQVPRPRSRNKNSSRRKHGSSSYNPTQHYPTPQLSTPQESLEVYKAKETYLNHTIYVSGTGS